MPVSLDPSWRRAAGRAGRELAALAARVRLRWRHSLQTRVVVTTLAASGLVVALFVSLLVDQVGRGLLETKKNSALSEARSGLLTAQGEVDVSTATGQVAAEDLLQRIAQRLSDRGSTGGLYSIVLVGSPENKAFASPGTVRSSDVPTRLVERLGRGPGPVYEFAPVPTPTGGRRDGIVVGSVLSVPSLGQYRLVHLFPLTAEEQTLSLVRRTAAAAGLLLVLLLALIALLVTRQVVSPVQLAARTAGRLAAGHLDERMRVRGDDELARLGSTFNTMAEALQSQIRQLEDLSRVQRRFVSDVSHELRTPLTTVRLAADVLFDGREAFPPQVARAAELLNNELDRFEALLGDLLEISRYDAGAASLDPTATDLVPLVHRVVDAARPLAGRRGIRFDLRRVPSAPVIAEMDPIRIERVLRNLVVNAVEHAEGRPVQVAVAGNHDTVAVRVRDFGVGLEPGQAGLVFTRFWRADPSRARSTGGTGLGLAIALEDVRLHGGWLQASGTPGKGATFLVTLPRRAGRPPGNSPLPLVHGPRR